MITRRGSVPLERNVSNRTKEWFLTGFTLVELLVVIAIIALLMSILMPALSRVRNQAQAVRGAANLKQWGLIFAMYTDENNGYFNEGWGFNDHYGRSNELGLWMNALRPYYKDEWDLFLCPTAKRVVLGSSDWGTFKAQPRTLQNRYPAPGEGANKEFIFSYSINSWTNYMIKGRGSHRPVENFWKNAHNSRGGNNIPVFGDNTWHDAWPQVLDTPPPTSDAAGWGSFGTRDEMWQFCINRHGGFVNLLFMDWTVRKVGLKELWTLKWHRSFDTSGYWTLAGGVRASDWPKWMRSFKDY